MVLLIAEGPSFTFHALGISRREVKRAFADAWKEHVRQTDADPNPENAVTINYIDPIRLGAVYRDYEKLKPVVPSERKARHQ